MDCKSTFLLKISELLWCSAIIANTTWKDVVFTKWIDKISRKLSDYAEKDRSELKKMLLEVSAVVDSKYVSGDLVTYLSRRFDARCGEVVRCAPNLPVMDNIGMRTWKAIMFNESVAIKAVNREWDRVAESKASVMATLNHPGIVPLLGVTSHPKYGPCVIMELMSGDLDELIRQRRQFSLHVSVDIILQIADAMQHVHNAGLVYEDLNPRRILFKVVEDEHLSGAGFLMVKVACFEGATESKEGELSENIRISNSKDYVLNFGLVCHEILSVRPPREGWTKSEMMIWDGKWLRLPDTCPPKLASLIEQCWSSDPNSRPDFERICLELRHIKTMLITGSSSSIKFS